MSSSTEKKDFREYFKKKFANKVYNIEILRGRRMIIDLFFWINGYLFSIKDSEKEWAKQLFYEGYVNENIIKALHEFLDSLKQYDVTPIFITRYHDYQSNAAQVEDNNKTSMDISKSFGKQGVQKNNIFFNEIFPQKLKQFYNIHQILLRELYIKDVDILCCKFNTHSLQAIVCAQEVGVPFVYGNCYEMLEFCYTSFVSEINFDHEKWTGMDINDYISQTSISRENKATELVDFAQFSSEDMKDQLKMLLGMSFQRHADNLSKKFEVFYQNQFMSFEDYRDVAFKMTTKSSFNLLENNDKTKKTTLKKEKKQFLYFIGALDHKADIFSCVEQKILQTHFYSNLQRNFDQLFEEKFDLNKVNLIFPFVIKNHEYLCELENTHQIIRFYDSLCLFSAKTDVSAANITIPSNINEVLHATNALFFHNLGLVCSDDSIDDKTVDKFAKVSIFGRYFELDQRVNDKHKDKLFSDLIQLFYLLFHGILTDLELKEENISEIFIENQKRGVWTLIKVLSHIPCSKQNIKNIYNLNLLQWRVLLNYLDDSFFIFYGCCMARLYLLHVDDEKSMHLFLEAFKHLEFNGLKQVTFGHILADILIGGNDTYRDKTNWDCDLEYLVDLWHSFYQLMSRLNDDGVIVDDIWENVICADRILKEELSIDFSKFVDENKEKLIKKEELSDQNSTNMINPQSPSVVSLPFPL
eukprot:TRINITY_DN2903_c0_g3_i1.p1 TRINITY_DN2903_c0_g3~~TRINITY_DN2903_c0_g3_i1.p1  ORF type:complete len:697 (+),score=202.39 TRINITY_DN2903_c0_g3_i1:53-2143(+)